MSNARIWSQGVLACRRVPSRLWPAAVLTLTAALWSAPAGADMVVTVWQAGDGLPQSDVTSIAQTPDGYLWVGTRWGGLARFDGVRFVNFTPANTPELISGEIHRLDLDVHGALWVSMVNGALAVQREGHFQLRFRPEFELDRRVDYLLRADATEALFVSSGGLLLRDRIPDAVAARHLIRHPDNETLSLACADEDGVVWYRTPDGWLGRWWEDRFERLPEDCGLEGRNVTALVTDVSYRIWVGTDREIAVWQDGRFRAITRGNGWVSPPVLQMAFAGDGSLWVLTRQGLSQWLDNEWVHRAAPARLPKDLGPSSPILLKGDADGGAWLISSGVGILRVAPDGAVQHLSDRDGLPSTVVNCWFQDDERNVWLGTSRGLVRLRPALFQSVGVRQGLPDAMTRSVCEGRDGFIWIGTASGLARWRDGNVQAVPFGDESSPVASANVTVAPKADGLWVGSASGLRELLLDPEQDVIGLTMVDSSVSSIRSLLVDRRQRLWFGSEFGLFSRNHLGLQGWGRPGGLGPAVAFGIAEDPNDGVWVAAGSTVRHWSQGGFITYRPPGHLRISRLLAVLPDADGTVWLGALGGGLLRLREGEFFPYTPAHGLPRVSVTQLVEDHLGFLWAGTDHGVFRVSMATLRAIADGQTSEARINRYDRSHGLPSNECSQGYQPACWRARDGRLWFTTHNGVVSVDPAAVRENLRPPRLFIEETLVNGEPVAMPPRREGRQTLRLGPGRTHLEFRFTGLSFAAPELIRFRWRMEGMDDDWLEAGDRRTVTYNALAPGRYLFRVKACNSDGAWNEVGADVAVEVLPFVWETGWFRAAAAATVLGLVVAVVLSYQRRRHRRSLAALERQRELERERGRIARDIHDDLGASLTQITLLTQSARAKLHQPAQVAEGLDRIVATARNLRQTLEQIVWAINPRHDTVEGLGSFLSKYATEFLRTADIRCRLDLPIHLPVVPLDSPTRHQLFLAFKETLNNIARHAGATEVSVALRAGPTIIEVILRDNGQGFDPSGAADHGHHGLGNLQSRLAEMGGRCEVHSTPGRGTEVRLLVPLPARNT